MKEERDEQIRRKAEILLYKLYRMWARFTISNVDDFMEMATDEEISYYYYMICVRR
jgi:hypothetical protein